MRAYARSSSSGALEIVHLAKLDGQVYTQAGTQLTPTGELVTLRGWPDAAAEVYATELGDEFLVPTDGGGEEATALGESKSLSGRN